MEKNDLYRRRLTRILQAVALEEPDRIPVVLEYSGFAAYVTGTRMADFLGTPAKNLETMTAAWRLIGGADAINYGSFWPFELLCGSRSLLKFSMDLMEIPDKVAAAMDAIVPYLAGAAIRRAADRGYPLVWIGGWRTASCMLSPKMFMRFVWPYFRRLVGEVTDAGLIALLHLDSNWTRELERFRELPQGKCIMALDGETDIFKAKKVLGDHMCLMGDVPASMLYLESPEAVAAYCARLVHELGPNGFILQSGCDIPANARLENVKAMVAAAVGNGAESMAHSAGGIFAGRN